MISPFQQTVKHLLRMSLTWLGNDRMFTVLRALFGEELIKYAVLKPERPIEIAIRQNNERGTLRSKQNSPMAVVQSASITFCFMFTQE